MTISRSKTGPTRYKVEVGGWSLTVYRSSLLRALEAVVVILVSLLLFRMGQAQALHERGHEAIGGEYLLLGLPVLYYLLWAVLKDYLADRRPRKTIVIFDELHGLRDRNTYEIMRQSAIPYKDLVNTAKEAGTAFCSVGINAEAVASAFGKISVALAEAYGPPPLNVAFLAPDHRLANIAYQQLLKDNDLLGIYPRRRYPTTLMDGTRFTLISGKSPDAAAKGRRFDQVIAVTTATGQIAPEVAHTLELFKQRATGRVPEEFFVQYYDMDADEEVQK